MEKINDYVSGEIAVSQARAALHVADLEAKERRIPVIGATSNQRLRVARELKEARSRLATWNYLVRALEGVDAEIKGK